MVATPDASPDPAEGVLQRVALGIRSEGNAALVREIVSDLEVVAYEPRSGGGVESDFDLAIVDAATLARTRDELVACRRRSQPVILPTLLILDARADAADAAARELGTSVDDILRIPATRREVRARIENLLRLRFLSRRQHEDLEEADRALEGANRALQTLHAGNDVLVRAHAEQELLREICRVIVEQDQYELAWVGFTHSQAEDPEILPTAVAGDSAGYVDRLRLTYSDFGDGPAWRAVDGRCTIVAPELATAVRGPASGPSAAQARVREQIEAYGLGSVIVLPIQPEKGAIGVLAIYSRRRGAFRDDERAVLERLAANLEYGINALRADAERDRQKEAIKDLAYSDSLTGLPNRAHLVERLDDLLREQDDAPHVAVLFVDLDNFKIINDALGHVAGDTVIRQVAQRLQQLVRPGDFVARQGGDEFIIVMTEPPRSEEWSRATSRAGGFAEAARTMGERLAERLAGPIIVEGYERRIGASVGISLHPDHGRTAGDLIDCADTAMYAAKSDEGNVRLYTEGISERRQRRLSLEARLHKALAEDEFRLHYQPVFELVSGRIEGVEALLRWPQADGSFVSPGEFMPVAEETGLIVELGDWVLRTAVTQRAQWLRQGHDLLMAVNVSVRQLKHPDATRDLLAAVGHAVDPTRIELEVTESDLMDESGMIRDSLHALHMQGFRVAVDDFGTGYSSLSRLQAMPITTLKIDKGFVAGLGQEDRGAVIARSVQHLADGLGVRCLAEGVETDTQRQLLVDLGCRVGQGFWLSGALPPDELIEMVRTRAGADDGAAGPG